MDIFGYYKTLPLNNTINLNIFTGSPGQPGTPGSKGQPGSGGMLTVYK